MSEPDTTAHHPTGPASHASGATTVTDARENAIGSQPEKSQLPQANNTTALTYSDPPHYFADALEDAERLLKYAAEAGVDVDDKTRSSVLKGRLAVNSGWNEQTAGNLLAALTKLAAQLKPVTAESLSFSSTRSPVGTYWKVAVCLAALIIPFSVASFVSSAISNSIRQDISTANELAVKLTAQIGGSASTHSSATATSGTIAASNSALPPGLSQVDVITELQTFASLIRAIYARTRQLNWLILRAVKDPFSNLKEPGKFKDTFQLPVPLPSDLAPVLSGRITVYQDARSFGQEVLDDVSVFYGATTVCILPALYALLGTCAYLLRSFSEGMRSRTYVPSHSDSARFLIAGIGGTVVGLFNNLSITQGASIPPLAIAFLVGYAVDVFFSFLEGLIQAFTRNKPGSSTTSPPLPAAASKP